MNLPERLVAAFRARGWSLASAESLTAGLVSAGVADVPGASDVLRGGVTAYATACKHSVLGVDATLLDQRGAVDAEVARQMACGTRVLFSADVGISTTGVAGPAEQDGHPVGTVYVAIAYPGESQSEPVRCHSRALHLEGDRGEIRRSATEAAWQLCLEAAEQGPHV